MRGTPWQQLTSCRKEAGRLVDCRPQHAAAFQGTRRLIPCQTGNSGPNNMPTYTGHEELAASLSSPAAGDRLSNKHPPDPHVPIAPSTAFSREQKSYSSGSLQALFRLQPGATPSDSYPGTPPERCTCACALSLLLTCCRSNRGGFTITIVLSSASPAGRSGAI